MKRNFYLIIFLCLISSSFIFAEEWSTFSSESQDSALVQENATSLPSESVSQPPIDSSPVLIKKQYTDNFYLALWIGSGGALLLLFFLYLLFKKPMDHFKQKS